MDLRRRLPMDLRRRLMGAMAVGVVLLAAYLVFPYKRQHFKSDGNCLPAIYNFGDSNSDTGSYTAALGRLLPPYGETYFGKPPRRFTDGRLIIDFMVERLDLPYLGAYLDSVGTDFQYGANFASAGSTIQHLDVQLFNASYNPFTLDIQVTQFEQFKARSFDQSYGQGKDYDSKLSSPKPECLWSALFTIDHGQNDLHAGLTLTTEEEVIESIPNIIKQFSTALERLYELGARSFWIHNTGPIGCLPWFLIKNPPEPSNVDSIGCIKSYNEVAQEFNNQLKVKIFELQNQFGDAMFLPIDMFSIKYSLISRGKNNGFSNPLGYCCGDLKQDPMIRCGEKRVIDGRTIYVCCDNPSEYISWDGIHYTDAANKWIVDHIFGGSFFGQSEFSRLKSIAKNLS